MLVFHGTRVDRGGLASIFRDGLRATPRPWMHEVSGEDRFCFVATQPVAGVGGDPVWFAMQLWWSRRARDATDGWIVVLDLPQGVAKDVVVAAVPNLELEHYFTAQHYQRLFVRLLVPVKGRGALGPRYFDVLLALGRDEEALRELADTPATCFYVDSALHLNGASFAVWRDWVGSVAGARTLRDVERAGRRCGVRWERPEVVHCLACAHALAGWHYALPERILRGFGDPPPSIALPTVMHNELVSSADWAVLARRIAAWCAGVEAQSIRAALATLSKRDATWSDAFDRLPIDHTRVPAVWRPDFGRRWTMDDLRRPDVQLACRAIGPEHVRGAIRIASGAQLLPWARPRGGDTLVSRLWRAAHAIMDRYRGVPVRYEGG